MRGMRYFKAVEFHAFFSGQCFSRSARFERSHHGRSIDLIVSARAPTRFKCKLQQTNSIRRRRRRSASQNSAKSPTLRTRGFLVVEKSGFPIDDDDDDDDDECSFCEYMSLCRGVMFRKYWRRNRLLSLPPGPSGGSLCRPDSFPCPPSPSPPQLRQLICRHPNWLDTSDEREAST